MNFSLSSRFCFRPARKEDLPAVVVLYHAAIGRDGCTWNESYPTADDAAFDYENHCLYVLTDEKTVIGAISVVPENELDDLPFWTVHDGHHRELARLTVSEAYRGAGLAKQMLTALFSLLAAEGCTSVRLLAAVCNEAAQKTYRALGFSFLSTCEMYENIFYACEKKL